MVLTKRRFIIAFRKLFHAGKLPGRVVVACSGGVDSMVLLDLMRQVSKTHSGGDGVLDVLHLDHGQRAPAAAVQDTAVIREYCDRHAISLTIRRLQLQPGASEAVMRRARYAAFARVAHSNGAAAGGEAVILTAHHADDELETLLFRLIRGTHPESLRGIAARARRSIDGTDLKIVRPLLLFTKAEIYAYARENDLRWCEDSTNANRAYARNRIRHELIPLLESLRPGATRRIRDFFAGVADLQIGVASRGAAIEPRRLARQLASEHGVLVKEAEFSALRAAIHILLDELSHRTTRAHWDTLKQQLEKRAAVRRGGGPEKFVQFPGGYAVRFHGNRLFWTTGA